MLEVNMTVDVEFSKAQHIYVVDYVQNSCDVVEKNPEDPQLQELRPFLMPALKKLLRGRSVQFAPREAQIITQGIDFIEHQDAVREDRESCFIAAIAEEALDKLKAGMEQAGVPYEYDPGTGEDT